MALTTLGRIEAKIHSDIYRTPSTRRDPPGEVPVSDGISTLEEAVRVSQEVGEHQRGVALSNLAAALEQSGWLDDSIVIAREALPLLASSPDEYVSTLITLAGSYRQLNRLDEAAQVLLQGFEIGGAPGQRRPMARLLNVLASTELNQGKTQSAIDHARRSVQIGEETRDRRHLSHALTTLARALLRLEPQTSETLRDALEAVTQARRYSRETGNRLGSQLADEIEERIRERF